MGDNTDIQAEVLPMRFISLETLDYYRSIESSMSTRPLYMEFQPHLSTYTRASLVRHLSELQQRFHLAPETLGLAVGLLDRFLARKTVTKSKPVGVIGTIDRNFLLVAVTCLFIASKLLDFRQEFRPHMRLVEYIRGLHPESGFEMTERAILIALDFRINIPTSHIFLRIFLDLAVCESDECVARDAYFVLNCTLGRYHLLEYLPSEIACGSIIIARLVNGLSEWSDDLAAYTKYNKDEILPVSRSILSTVSRGITMSDRMNSNIVPTLECLYASL